MFQVQPYVLSGEGCQSTSTDTQVGGLQERKGVKTNFWTSKTDQASGVAVSQLVVQLDVRVDGPLCTVPQRLDLVGNALLLCQPLPAIFTNRL